MSKYHRKKFISYSVIQGAVGGDSESINKIIDHYSGYINKLSTKDVKDKDGNCYKMVDEHIKRSLETKLIMSILKYKL